MRIVVCGSRDGVNRTFVCKVLSAMDETDPITELAEGGAEGADALAHEWMRELKGRSVSTYPANWDTNGRAAGPIRNAKMLDEFKPDVVVAFKKREKSAGTDDCIRKAKARGIPVMVFVWPMLVEDGRTTKP